jgi:hypothetical protein
MKVLTRGWRLPGDASAIRFASCRSPGLTRPCPPRPPNPASPPYPGTSPAAFPTLPPGGRLPEDPRADAIAG